MNREDFKTEGKHKRPQGASIEDILAEVNIKVAKRSGPRKSPEDEKKGPSMLIRRYYEFGYTITAVPIDVFFYDGRVNARTMSGNQMCNVTQFVWDELKKRGLVIE